MEIFGKYIFGSDAEQFKSLPILNQVEWIKKNTNQKNNDLIDEFLSNIPENNDKNCIDCGNKRKGISEKITTDVVDSDATTNSGRGNTKRKRNHKRT